MCTATHQRSEMHQCVNFHPCVASAAHKGDERHLPIGGADAPAIGIMQHGMAWSEIGSLG